MIIEYTKTLSKCSKQELLLLLQGEVDNRHKLIKLIETEYDKLKDSVADMRFPMYQSPYKEGFLDGIEFTENIVRNFYHKDAQGE